MSAIRLASLRSRLLLGAVLVLLPVLALMVSVAWMQYVAARQSVRSNAQNLARELVNQQGRQIEAARRLLLNETIPLVDVSTMVGFEGQSYFSKVFKKMVGVTPGRYRESRGKTKPVA
jgi:hypothetical protein